MGKRTVFIILASLPVDIALAVFGFVSRRVIQLLNFIVSVGTKTVLTTTLTTLHVRIVHFCWVTTLITVVVVIMTACQLMSRALSHGAQLSFEGLEFETEELILLEKLSLMIMERTAKQTIVAGIVVTFGSFILERMVDQFVHVVAPRTLLPTPNITSS